MRESNHGPTAPLPDSVSVSKSGNEVKFHQQPPSRSGRDYHDQPATLLSGKEYDRGSMDSGYILDASAPNNPPRGINFSQRKFSDDLGLPWSTADTAPMSQSSISSGHSTYMRLTGNTPVGKHNFAGFHCDSVEQSRVLAALFRIMGGVAWKYKAGWNSPLDITLCHGLEVDYSGHVVKLNLQHNGLRGQIPTELGDLTALETLDLMGNQLSGLIPATLGSLLVLKTLNLSNNQLSGQIPRELATLPLLETLNLAENMISGVIPMELGRLRSLKELDLRSNNLLPGFWPAYPPLFHVMASNFVAVMERVRGVMPGVSLEDLLYVVGTWEKLKDSIEEVGGDVLAFDEEECKLDASIQRGPQFAAFTLNIYTPPKDLENLTLPPTPPDCNNARREENKLASTAASTAAPGRCTIADRGLGGGAKATKIQNVKMKVEEGAEGKAQEQQSALLVGGESSVGASELDRCQGAYTHDMCWGQGQDQFRVVEEGKRGGECSDTRSSVQRGDSCGSGGGCMVEMQHCEGDRFLFHEIFMKILMVFKGKEGVDVLGTCHYDYEGENKKLRLERISYSKPPWNGLARVTSVDQAAVPLQPCQSEVTLPSMMDDKAVPENIIAEGSIKHEKCMAEGKVRDNDKSTHKIMLEDVGRVTEMMAGEYIDVQADATNAAAELTSNAYFVEALAMCPKAPEVGTLVSASVKLLGTSVRPVRRQAAVVIFNLCGNPVLRNLLLQSISLQKKDIWTPVIAPSFQHLKVSPADTTSEADAVISAGKPAPTRSVSTGRDHCENTCNARVVASNEEGEGVEENVVGLLVRLALNKGAKRASNEKTGYKELDQEGEEIGTRRMCMRALSLLVKDSGALDRRDFRDHWEKLRLYAAGSEVEDVNIQHHLRACQASLQQHRKLTSL